MSCCQSCSLQGTNEFFTDQAKRYLKEFKKKGLGKEQKYLIEGIASQGIAGKTVLEIGCGVGGLHLSLLKQGAVFATGIDISEGMIAGAKELSKELNLVEKTQYHVGDVIQLNKAISDADIVVLDKVVCCYEDVFKLLSISGNRTKQTYAFSYPNPNILVQISFKGLIALRTLFRGKFRPYWHDWSALIKTLETQGFKQTYTNNTLLWNVCVLTRK